MVTILPIDVDEELVREGVLLAVSARVRGALKELDQQAIELASAGIVDRGKWHRLFALLDEVARTTDPVLEYARAFADQWPEDDDSAATE